MAILRKFVWIISFICACICCINDAVLRNEFWILADVVLTSILLLLLTAANCKILIKIGLLLLLPSLVIYRHTSIASYLLFLPSSILLMGAVLKLIIRKSSAYLPIAIFTLSLFCGSRSFWLHQVIHQSAEKKVAVLEHGRWGNALPYEKKLNITSQYSYDLLHRFIGASRIDDLDQLESYNELWLITPTKPFNDDQNRILNSWVSKGGRLVIVTDHTDLFGHASSLSSLMNEFGIYIQKDVILDQGGDGGTYFSFFGAYSGLSANSIQGAGETWLFQPGYQERTDYSKRSFFSDNQISDEEMIDVFCIGLRKQHGLGGVILFGDSTLFANFALARPSAQVLLNKMLLGGGFYSCYGMAFFSSLISVSLFLPCRVRIGMLVSVFLTISCLCYFVKGRDRIQLNSVSPVKCSGDWSLVEGQDARLLTLFSSAYVASDLFPIWSGPSDGTRRVIIGQHIIEENDIRSALDTSQQSLRENLESPFVGNVQRMLDTAIKNSGVTSFWFDEGIGIIKETAYRQFWTRVTNSKDALPVLSLGTSYALRMKIKARDEDSFQSDVLITPIIGAPKWVVLGNGIIGQFIDSDTILVRNIWQVSNGRFSDFYCRREG